MSGRLIILPKKSYNPWSKKNIERVERDERLERERLERERVEIEKEASERRMDQLKKKNELRSQSSETKIPRHVNFFAQEEKEMLSGKNNNEARAHVKNHPDIKTRFGGDMADDMKKDAFPFFTARNSSRYPNENESSELREQKRKEREEKRKANDDPMKNFVHDSALDFDGNMNNDSFSDNSYLERKKKRKKRRRKNKHASKGSGARKEGSREK